MELVLTLSFPKGYIGHAYWPELERIINIERESGLRRTRSEANRNRALTKYLNKVGMTPDELSELRQRAERPFYTTADVERLTFGQCPLNGHEPDEIVIPQHQIYGCLAQAADLARPATRVGLRDQIRSVLGIKQPIYTGKNETDGACERFAAVTGGTGAKLSNQRALRRNAYIGSFACELAVHFDQTQGGPQKVEDFRSRVAR